MKLAMINTINPSPGIGEGITEYAYNLLIELRKTGLRPDLIYSRYSGQLNEDRGAIINKLCKKMIFLYDSYNINKFINNASDYDIVHILNQEMGFASKRFKNKKTTKIVTTIHDLNLFETPKYLTFDAKFLRYTYYTLVKNSINDAVKLSDFIIFDSKLTRKKFVSRYGDKYNTAVVNLGIPNEFVSRKIHKEQNRKEFIVGYLGALEPKKNLMLILNSAKSLLDYKSIKFYIYGKGSLYKKYLEYSVINKLYNVRFMGFVETSRILKVYDSFDVFIDPITSAGFELPILEAQARGLPVIIDNNSEIPEEVNRYCLKAMDAGHMAQIIKDLKENGYNERQRIKAMEYARSFTWKRCAEETLGVYNMILDKVQ